MTAATAAIAEQLWDIPDPDAPARTRRPAKTRRVSAADTAPPAEYAEKAQQVSAELTRIADDRVLREEIAQQIHMLENELKKRAERLAAMEDAVVTQRTVEARRARRRARAGQKIAMAGTGMLAAMFTGLFVISVL